MPAPISEYVPQVVSSEEAARRRRAAFATWGALAAWALLFVGVVVLAPWARAHGFELLSKNIYRAFSVACHQMPERSFHVEGLPLAVCARCTGLYVGGAVGVLVYPLVRSLTAWNAAPPRRAWLILAALPTTVDFALGFFGLWENTHLSRFLTAAVLGAASTFYIVPGVLDFTRTYWPRFSSAIFSRVIERVTG